MKTRFRTCVVVACSLVFVLLIALLRFLVPMTNPGTATPQDHILQEASQEKEPDTRVDETVQPRRPEPLSDIVLNTIGQARIGLTIQQVNSLLLPHADLTGRTVVGSGFYLRYYRFGEWQFWVGVAGVGNTAPVSMIGPLEPYTPWEEQEPAYPFGLKIVVDDGTAPFPHVVTKVLQ